MDKSKKLVYFNFIISILMSLLLLQFIDLNNVYEFGYVVAYSYVYLLYWLIYTKKEKKMNIKSLLFNIHFFEFLSILLLVIVLIKNNIINLYECEMIVISILVLVISIIITYLKFKTDSTLRKEKLSKESKKTLYSVLISLVIMFIIGSISKYI